MQKKINTYPNRQAFGKEEISLVRSVINYYSKKKIDPPYQGIFEKKLSLRFSKFMHGGFALPVATGTSAALIALQALMLKEKSEILISAVNDSGPINSLIFLNLRPKIIDSKKNSYNIDLNSLKKKITKKTRAVLITHIAGQSLEISKIKNFLKKKNIFLIEDCSQAPGAECYQCEKRCDGCVNKKVGEFGDISLFSTMYRKNISSGGSGGIVFTKKEKIFRKIQAFADRGKQPWKKINQNDPSMALFPALNHNTNEFSCAITLASLNRLDKTNKKRREILKYLIKKMKACLVCKPSYFDNGFAPFFFPIEVNEKLLKVSKKEFAKNLKRQGVGCLEEYNCVVSKWKWIKKYFKSDFFAKNATDYSNKTFNLFINENLKKIQIDKIVNIIINLEKKFLK